MTIGIIQKTHEGVNSTEKQSLIESVQEELYKEKLKTGKVPNKEKLKEIITKIDEQITLKEESFILKGSKEEVKYTEILGWE